MRGYGKSSRRGRKLARPDAVEKADPALAYFGLLIGMWNEIELHIEYVIYRITKAG